jgi:hypothetical protein
MVIEAAGCLKTYEKTAAGHECTTLVMDKCAQTSFPHCYYMCNNFLMHYEVATHTAQIQTQVFPSILGRPHAAPVVRGVFFLDQSAGRVVQDAKLRTSVSREAESFWKVPPDYAIALLSFYFDNCKRCDVLQEMHSYYDSHVDLQVATPSHYLPVSPSHNILSACNQLFLSHAPPFHCRPFKSHGKMVCVV